MVSNCIWKEKKEWLKHLHGKEKKANPKVGV
jgi:hypothetical protein